MQRVARDFYHPHYHGECYSETNARERPILPARADTAPPFLCAISDHDKVVNIFALFIGTLAQFRDSDLAQLFRCALVAKRNKD